MADCDSEYILGVLHRIPVEPQTVKRSDLLGPDILGSRRITLQARIYALPEFVLIAEDKGQLCFLSDEAKRASIREYCRWIGKEISDEGEENLD